MECVESLDCLYPERTWQFKKKNERDKTLFMPCDVAMRCTIVFVKSKYQLVNFDSVFLVCNLVYPEII